MQIESSFRDLKSHHYGQSFEDSLTRRSARLQILLLVNTLTAFASWLAGMGCEVTGIAQWLLPIRAKRKLHSTLRVGREVLVRCWPVEPVSQWLDRLRSLPPAMLDQMLLPILKTWGNHRTRSGWVSPPQQMWKSIARKSTAARIRTECQSTSVNEWSR